MVAAVGFSQSRGGAIALAVATAVAWLTARLARHRSGTVRSTAIGLVLLGGVVLTAGLLTAWLGWAESSIGSPASGREPPTIAATSVGPRVEPGRAVPARRRRRRRLQRGRTGHPSHLRRLLPFGLGAQRVPRSPDRGRRDPVRADGWARRRGARAAVRRYNRTGDPLLLGCVFGISAVAIHSIGDFGIHVPSVALATAVVAAYSRGQERGDRRQETARRESDRVQRLPSRAWQWFLSLPRSSSWRLTGARGEPITSGRWQGPCHGPPTRCNSWKPRRAFGPTTRKCGKNSPSAHLLAAAESSHTALTALVGFAALAEMPNVCREAIPTGT